GCYLVSGLGDRAQHRHRKLRRAHEDDAKRHLPYPTSLPGALSLASFLNFLTTMSRLSFEMWSMNSTPLRWSISCCRQVAISPSASISCSLPSRSRYFTRTEAGRSTSA